MQIVTAKTYTHQVLTEDIEKLAGAYPFLNIFSIGKSVFGHELFALSWGRGEKKILINGAHHGMEWITSLLVMQMLETLCRHKVSEESIGTYQIAELFERVTLVAVPMVNPDGVDLATGGLFEGMAPIMRTRLISYNSGSEDFSSWQANANGVDLNHNYDAAFYKGVFMQHKLNIFGPGPTRYSGNEPESEPESRALAAFTREFYPHIAVAYHSQGKVIYDDFESLVTEQGRQMARAMSDISGYELDMTEGMASYSGYKDWVMDAFRIPAFTIEVGFGKNPLPLSQADEIYEDNLPMLLYLMQM